MTVELTVNQALQLSEVARHEGKFEETAKAYIQNIGPVVLVHIDCDIYSSITYCYTAIKKHLVNGAYIVFDDCLYSDCLGAFEAVEGVLIKQDGLKMQNKIHRN